MVISRQGEWRSELPATLEAVEEFCAEFQRWRARVCADLNSFSSALLLRESLTNAVIHGCAEDPRKRISCVLRAKPGRLLIAIRDEGDGFDWRAAWDRRSDVPETRGRGVEILRRYSNSIRFNRKGNSVALVKRFEIRNEVKTNMNNEMAPPDASAAVLQPAGDLVAAILPAVRSTMREMVESGTLHMTVDLAAVRAVDSSGIGLLVSAHNSLKKAGGDLTVIHASPDILELFRTMRIHQHFSVSGD